MSSIQCKNDYVRFGSGGKLEEGMGGIEADYRVGFSIAFYVIFCFIQGNISLP